MSRLFDLASLNEEQVRQDALARIRREPTLQHTGRCLYCDEDVGPDKRFCDAECLRDFERERAAKRRNGK